MNVGSGGKAAVVSTIVNTLGQFPFVKSVKILMEGQGEPLAGHVGITRPMVPDSNSIFRTFPNVEQH